MYTVLTQGRLPNGKEIECGVVLAPDADYEPTVTALLGHKGHAWAEHIAAAFAGDTDELETRFYLATVRGTVVANIMTVERAGVGILGHVFTVPEARRQGICKTLMGAQNADFRARGGKRLVLGTGFESHPYWIYHSFGFRSLRGGFMAFSVNPGVDPAPAWYDPGDAVVAPCAWRHWPGLAILAAADLGDEFRSAAWDVADIGNLESPYVRFMQMLREEPGVQGAVLEGGSGAAMGWATITRMPSGYCGGWPGAWLLDSYVHPSAARRLPDLLEALQLPAGKTLAWAPVGDELRASAYRGLGLAREGVVKGLMGGRDAALFGIGSAADAKAAQT
ncbi:MAG: hypothetical protein NT029_16350 [Armatimonadetes bacterium]|nr:hypothetical protein [Armatimonadota bacterium]